MQPGQRAVVDRGAVVDHDHPVAERLDVLEVVGGEHQGGAALGVERAQELAQPTLADHVEADRRLVEVEHLRVVQQRRGDVAAHPLAEAELAHRGVELVAEVEQLDEAVEVVAVARRAVRYIFWSRSNESRSGRSHHSVERWPKTTPIRRGQLDAVAAAGRAPATRTCPPVGTRMPVSILIVVDFPAPFGPM